MDACGRCGGAGTVKCPKCKGEGRIRKAQGIDDLGRPSESMLCDHMDCHGTGKMTCPTCRGRGRL